MPGDAVDNGPHPDLTVATIHLTAGIAQIVSSLIHPRTYIDPVAPSDLDVVVGATVITLTVPSPPAGIPKVFADIIVEGGNIRYRHVPTNLTNTPLDATLHGSLLSDGQGIETTSPDLFRAIAASGTPKLRIEFFGFGQSS